MNGLTPIADFIKREKLYIALFAFILLVTAVNLVQSKDSKSAEIATTRAEDSLLKEELTLTREKIEVLIREKREVVIAMNFLALAVILLLILGVVLDGLLLFYVPREKTFARGADFGIRWGTWDVCKVVILSLFFGYVFVMLETAFEYVFPAIKNREHVRIMLNSSILDTFAVAFVLYMVVIKYGQSVRKLGLSASNFFRDVFIGIAGYVAAMPVLAASLLLIVWLATVLNYDPPVEPILRLFLEERSVPFLLYATVFATVCGPIMEEIFFRGFMYSALKKKTGVIGAIIASSFIFSILHTNVTGFLPIMILGALLAYLYERTGSLVPSITMHIIHNTGMMTFVFLLKELKGS